MEPAGVVRMYPGRLTGASGHGVESWMRQMDARPRDRVGMLAETVSALRGLLAGDTMPVAGYLVSLDDVHLHHPPGEPPRILVGATGERGLEIAGRHADGVRLAESTAPAARMDEANKRPARWEAAAGALALEPDR